MMGFNELKARIEEIRKKATSGEKQHTSDVLASPDDRIVRLPSWPDQIRAAPNGFLRSALFGAIGKGKRRFMKREQIAALEQTTGAIPFF